MNAKQLIDKMEMRARQLTDKRELADASLLMKAAQVIDAGRMIREGVKDYDGNLEVDRSSGSARLGVRCWDALMGES